jgi:predicted RNA binding protein YcfA (HicA-like mRNA interferase family)
VPVPPKVRDLIAELERAGFINRGGKGSHRNFVHPKVTKPITLSGKPGDDAKHYQQRAVRLAIEEATK